MRNNVYPCAHLQCAAPDEKAVQDGRRGIALVYQSNLNSLYDRYVYTEWYGAVRGIKVDKRVQVALRVPVELHPVLYPVRAISQGLGGPGQDCAAQDLVQVDGAVNVRDEYVVVQVDDQPLGVDRVKVLVAQPVYFGIRRLGSHKPQGQQCPK